MRHIVNFGLLFTFAALAVTGVLAFTNEFSITTTQIHILAGTLTLILVVLHVAGRIPYFKKQITKPKTAAITRLQLVSITGGAAILFLLAGMALPPVSWLVDLSYESRKRAEIVRTSSLTGFSDPSTHRKLVSRIPKDPGSSGLSLHISFPRELETLPSVAVWAETTAGTMIETLYLQQSLAYSDKPVWHGMKTRRNHILPIWRHRYTMVAGIDPEGKTDIVSGSTESHSYALDPYLVPGESQKFILCVEVNAPNDPNETWSDQKLGQPSLIYTAYVKVDEEQPYTILELTGHGGGSESSGNIQYDLEGFTTAKDLTDLLLVKLERKSP
jgi:hypothetical protein